MKKNIIKSIVFISLLVLLIFGMSKLFASIKSVHSSNVSIVGVSGEKINSLDYFVLGDSETYTSIIPLEIWNDYGYTGYVLGTSAQRLKETKEILEEALINQNPKVLILETNAIFRKPKKNNPKEDIKKDIKNLFKYHDNWKYLISKDFNKYSVNEKGYVYSTKIKKSTNPDYKVFTPEKKNISKDNINYLKDIINICKDNNIKILFISVPSSKNWTYKKHNAIEYLANTYNIDFIDFNIDDEVVIDWDNDTQDEGDHLNYYGALKVTKRLGEHLNEMNLLKDHRDDNYYKSWNDNYEKYMLKFNN